MRLNLRKTDSPFYQNLAAIDKEIALSAIDRWHWEMIKIKASQINGWTRIGVALKMEPSL